MSETDYEAVRAGLAAQAAATRAAEPGQASPDLSAAQAGSVDVAALQARLEQLEEAARAAAPPPPPPPDHAPHVSASSEVVDYLERLHKRVEAIESHLGISPE